MNWLRFVNLTPINAGRGSVAKMTSVELWQPVFVAPNDHMRLLPKTCRNWKRIDPLRLPPGALVAATVQLAMVQLRNAPSAQSPFKCGCDVSVTVTANPNRWGKLAEPSALNKAEPQKPKSKIG